MSNDLDKLMKKLKTDDPKTEVPKTKAGIVAPTPEPTPTPVTETEDIADDDDDEDEVEVVNDTVNDTDPVDPIPANVDDEHSIEAEVGLLQNNGIFRREMLLVRKEQVDVLKIMAQTLLDIKKKLIGDDDDQAN